MSHSSRNLLSLSRRLKLAVHAAALTTAMAFCGTAQAEIVQLVFSGTIFQSHDATHLGDSFEGYFFFNTSDLNQYRGQGLDYLGYVFQSTPFAESDAIPYYAEPYNPYQAAIDRHITPIPTGSPYPYLIGNAYLPASPDCFAVAGYYSCTYVIEMYNGDDTYSILYFSTEQSSNVNLLMDGPSSFAGANIQFAIYNDYYEIVAGNGTIGVRAAASLPVSAVPEPATWALMLAGAGMVGALQRRRRSSPAASL